MIVYIDGMYLDRFSRVNSETGEKKDYIKVLVESDVVNVKDKNNVVPRDKALHSQIFLKCNLYIFNNRAYFTVIECK